MTPLNWKGRRTHGRSCRNSGGSGPPTRGAARQAGFSMIELMMVVGIIGLLISILVPAAQQALEAARRLNCRANLRGIHQALAMYEHDHEGRLPIAPGTEGELGAVGSARNLEPVATTPTAVSATMWQILHHGGLDPKMFVCPSTQHRTDAAGPLDPDVWDFESADTLSYGIQYPYGQSTYLGRPLTSPSLMPLLADRGPYGGDGGDLSGMPDTSPADIETWLADSGNRAKVNSRNHGGAGQNIVFADGHAEWRDRPTAGPRGDNIYTVQSSDTVVGRMHGVTPSQSGPKEPAGGLDTVLVY